MDMRPHKAFEDTSQLMQRVGARVRRARDLKRMPRRVLSEVSGVSPRYLAQLEAGTGNISISLLARIARALDHRIEWLLSDDDPATSEAWQMVEWFRHATSEQRVQMRKLLAPIDRQVARASRVSLIGLRGAGKSTLGRRIGRALDMPFIELNREIEAAGQMPVGEMIALYGPEGYRNFERESLNRIIDSHPRAIIAVAGGIVSDKDAYKTLLARTNAIWLKAQPHEHMDRVRAQGDLRPMQGRPEAMDQLKSILKQREAQYERAEAQFDTSHQSVEAAESGLLKLILDRGFAS